MEIRITKATDIQRDDELYPFSWKGGEVIGVARTSKEFYDIVDNLDSYEDIVAFTGSASNLMTANAYIAHKLKEERGVVNAK